MYRKFIFSIILLLLPACALIEVQKPDLAELEKRNVSAPLIQKMQKGARLNFYDIAELSTKKVSDVTTLNYLKFTRAIYILTTADVEELKKAHISDAVIDHLLSTPKLYQVEEDSEDINESYKGGRPIPNQNYYYPGYPRPYLPAY
jgi:hypothetical protein